MEIAGTSGYAMSSPIEPVQERPFHGGTRRLLKRDIVLVTLETTDGARGVAPAGASNSAMREYFDGDSQGTFADIIEGPVADALQGAELDSPADVNTLLADTNLPTHLRSAAISAIDVAYYDLLGKEHGVPVYELLADEFDVIPKPEMRLYASAGMYMEPEGYVQQCRSLEECGFFGYKYRPGIGPDGDRRIVELLADATDDVELMLDVHTWWKLGEDYGDDVVRELVEHAADHGAYWVEEPVEPDDYKGYVELAKTGAPLAGGESERSPEGLLALAETGSIDFLQGDVRHHEGYSGCSVAVEYCRDRPIQFAPHNFGTWLGLTANAHLVAAAPETDLLEYPIFENDPLLDADPDPGMYPFELAFEILEEQPAVADGRMTVPDGPGLGVEVDMDVVDRYPFVEGPWTEFHYDD
jgi:L-alanine-DL-glutamate epimerase-like enolase superfamily enzyme